MRGFFVCILMAILTGCVSFQEKTFKLYQGQSELEVQKHLGKPKQVDGSQTSPRYVYFPDYDGYEFPFYVNFESGRLSSWGPDQERESQARQAAQAAAARNAAIANALQGMSDQMQKSRQPSGGRVDLSCVNRCTASGSFLDFCNSKCSY